jgi:hypothetical protein
VCDNRTGSSRSLQPQSVHYPGSTAFKLAWHGHQEPREVCAQHGRCRIENTGCSALADSIKPYPLLVSVLQKKKTQQGTLQADWLLKHHA